MTRSSGAFVVCLLLGAARMLAAEAEGPRVQLDLAPDPVGVDELATLTLRVDSQGFGLVSVDPSFDLENLQIASGPFRSQSQSWVNGATSSTTQLVWRLQPRSVGPARVRNVRVRIGERERALADAVVQVVREAPPGRAPGRREPPPDPFSGLFDEDPFGTFGRQRAAPAGPAPKVRVRSLVAPLRAYVGQQIDWQLLLDTQTDISGFRPRDMPDFHGFWAREVERPDRGKPAWVQVGGDRFGRVVMMERLLYPLRAGTYTLDPIRVDVVARLAEVGWFGRLGRDEPLLLQTEPVRVQVLPLPPGAPASFSGVVGPLALDARLESERIAAGGAAHLVLTATGPGHLQGLAPPRLELPPSLRAFPPSSDSTSSLDGGRWTTRTVWTYIVTAERAGTFELPPVRIGYFDPESSAYREAASAPIRLEVAEGAKQTLATATPDDRSEPTEAAGDAGAPSPSRIAPTEPAVWVAGGGALLLAGGLGAWRVARRRRGSPRPRRELLAALADAAGAPSARAAATALETAWRRFLTERYSLPRSIPVSQWSSRLASEGLAPDQIDELILIFEDLHLLEFAPELSDREGLRRELETRSRRLARRLR